MYLLSFISLVATAATKDAQESTSRLPEKIKSSLTLAKERSVERGVRVTGVCVLADGL